MAEYQANMEAETIASELISEFHPHLDGCKIAYLFKVSAGTKRKTSGREGKKITMAKTSMVPIKTRTLFEIEGISPYIFVIEFDVNIWNDLPDTSKKALVDHELLHCGNDTDGYYIRHHGIEEFSAILQRWGTWTQDVKEFAETAVQVMQHGGTQ